ncbi:MAG: recombinase family protein, partial [Synergistaceae bacterium]|nr:recombinase family protein [Synergistaceae bacterium]
TLTTKVGGKKRDLLPESEWIKVPGTHEAVVSGEVFQKAGAGIRRNSKYGVNGTKTPFAGKLKCGCCGHALRYYPSRSSHFICQGYGLNYGMGCSGDRLYLDDLNAAVLAAVKTEALKCFDERQKYRQAVKRESAAREAALSEIKRLAAQIGFIERRSDALYEDFAVGKIARDDFLAEKAKNTEELAGTETRIEELNQRLAIAGEEGGAPSDEALLRRVIEAADVTEEILSLIDCVIMYNPERIEIRFAFGDANNLQGIGTK